MTAVRESTAAPAFVSVGARGLGTSFWLSAGFLAVVVTAAVTAPWISPWNPGDVDFTSTLAAPSAEHLLGTDELGRDTLTRLLYGARATLLGALLILLIASVIGVPLGILAGWKRGWLDTVVSRGTDMFYAFPGLFFALLVIAVFGKGLVAVVVALGLAYFPTITKFTRSLARSEAARPYIDAYRVQGMGVLRVCFRCLLPNIAPSITGYVIVLFGDALMSLAGMSFLGFGSQPPASDWGLMVAQGQVSMLQGAVLPALAPGAAIALTAVAFNIVGLRVAEWMGRMDA